MPQQSSRITHLLAGVLGGLVVLAGGSVLIATDVIDTGDTTRQVIEQSPIGRPGSAGRGGDSPGLTVGEIYDRDGPGVVFIQARIVGRTESPFGFPQQQEGLATGSGFVLDKKGFVMTNSHLVQGARDVTVGFGGREEADAKVVGVDLSTDLAIVKVDPGAAKLTPLALGDSSKVRVGDPAIAIGNPFGFDRTVTTGIISALQRQIQAPNGFTISNVLQTDAPINPGNSGGPLLDATGKVIGINSQIATGGARQTAGIGFAVPINTAKEVIPQLREKGKVERAFLGVTTAPVNERMADDLNLPVDEGALIQEVVEGGPADRAGLRAGRTRVAGELVAGGDLIVEVDGRKISAPDDVAEAIADDKPGDVVEVEYYRGEKREKTKIKLGTRPASTEPAGGAESEAPDEGDIFPFPFP